MTKSRSHIMDAVGIGLVAVIILLACHAITGRRYLRAIADNDAVGYTTAARSLATTGKLTNHIIYPSTLLQKSTKNTLYMPGFYYLLAAAYKLFHYGTVQSLLVSGVCYVVAAICTLLIGLRCFDRLTGIVAAGLFLLYPANLYFSVTAMTELPLVAAAAIALCIFVHLPRRLMPWVGPLLVVLPFLFRETGAFLALPMAIILLMPPKSEGTSFRTNLARAALFLVLSVLLLGAIYASPISAGRPSLIKLDIFIPEKGAERIYRDALIGDTLKPTTHDWIRTLSKRFVANVRTMAWRCGHQQKEFFILVLLPLIAGIPIGLIWGWFKRDALALGAAFLLLLTLGFVCMFYSVRHDRPVRVTMFAVPLLALLAARVSIFSLRSPGVPAEFREWILGVTVVVAGAFIFAASCKGFFDMMAWDLSDERGNRLIDYLKLDEFASETSRATLVAPHLIGVPYLNQHPSITYSFVPANRKTLELLRAKYPFSTLIFHPDDAIDLTHADIKTQGFFLYRRVSMDGQHYFVYRKPAYAGQEMLWHPVAEEQFTWTPRQTIRY